MKRLLFLAILAAIGFFGLWPAYSAYSIYTGIDTKNEDTLTQKVDWPSVRASFKEAIEPTVTAEIEKQARKAGGPQGSLTGALGASLAPKIVDMLVESYMTPKGLIKLAETGGKIDVETAMAEFGGGLPGGLGGGNDIPGLPGGLGNVLKDIAGGMKNGKGGLGGLTEIFGGQKKSDSGNKSGGSQQPIPPLSLDNVKSFHFNSPTELEMSIAQKASARKPDLTAVMGFKDMDWKLVKLVPHF